MTWLSQIAPSSLSHCNTYKQPSRAAIMHDSAPPCMHWSRAHSSSSICPALAAQLTMLLYKNSFKSEHACWYSLLYRLSSILHCPLYTASLISWISSTDFHQSISLMKPSLTHILINLKLNWFGFFLRRKSNSSQSFLSIASTKMALLYQSGTSFLSASSSIFMCPFSATSMNMSTFQ